MTLYSDDKKDNKPKPGLGDLMTENKEDDDDDKLISLDKYYIGVVMQSLTNILRDSALATHHQTVMKVAMVIVKILGEQGITYLDGFVTAVVNRVYSAENQSTQEDLLKHIVEIIYVFDGGVIRHLSLIVTLSCEMLNMHMPICLDIIEALCTLTPPQHYNTALREMLPLLIQIIRTELIEDTVDSAGGIAGVSASGVNQISSGIGSEVISRQVLGRSNSDAPSLQSSTPGFSRGASFNNSNVPVLDNGYRKVMTKSRQILKTLATVAPYLREYTQQLIPIVLSVMEDKIVLAEVRREALCVVMHLATDARQLNVYAGRLIHPILRLISSDVTILQSSGFIALSTILCKIGSAFLPFVVTAKRKISAIMHREGMVKLPQMEDYEILLNRLLNQLPLPSEPVDSSLIFIKMNDRINMMKENSKSTHKGIVVNRQALETAWTLSGRITSSDLIEWMRRLSIELIRQSPSPIIHPCAVLAKVYQPLATELFNAAFVSVWTECFASRTSSLEFSGDYPIIDSLETALRSPQIPDNIRTDILNLAEFLEMQGKQLPIDLVLLATQTQAANQFAKCLHYREIEFASKVTTPSKECIEALITVNRQLDLRDAASGLLKVVQTRYAESIPIQPLWLEKLQVWEEARLLYLTYLNGHTKGSDPELTEKGNENNMRIGLLRCLRALGDHNELVIGARTIHKELEVAEAHGINSNIDESAEARSEVRSILLFEIDKN